MFLQSHRFFATVAKTGPYGRVLYVPRGLGLAKGAVVAVRKVLPSGADQEFIGLGPALQKRVGFVTKSGQGCVSLSKADGFEWGDVLVVFVDAGARADAEAVVVG